MGIVMKTDNYEYALFFYGFGYIRTIDNGIVGKLYDSWLNKNNWIFEMT